MAQIGQSKLFIIIVVAFLLISIPSYGQQTKIDYYQSDNVTNAIPYFENRFKIDALLEEITLLFYRRSGTPPIILVRPDGTKIKINNLPKDKITWFDDRTFDLITIKNPMPGPWQAIGDILPQSHIMVVTDVTIKVDPLPEVILSGETLKIEGHLYNGEQAIDDPLFRDVINLNVDFFSTNNSAYDNFGAEPIKIAQFRDDGRDLDEYAKDGVFTGEFELAFAPGEWLPIYSVIMPMATRELRQKPIILQKTPITISVEPVMEVGKSHKVIFTIDPTYVDMDSVLFQGKVIFPDRQEVPFSIMEGKGNLRTYELAYTESGVHRIQVSVFGKTINGREFRLVLEQFTFNAESKTGLVMPTLNANGEMTSLPVDKADVVITDKIILAEEKAKQLAMELQEAKVEQESAKSEKDLQTYIIIAVANVGIVLIALVFYFISRRKKNKK
ncbi:MULTISPECIES: TIGR03503 family protein [unclassified Colwellia]|uniref:TIGR03503 family protein n=1 Tax=unclassified Colwellia TaxID=196834 RepID=UPI0015F5434E|nr:MULTISPECIES: TIGR03503 family protein [unclassified Colwellia]MBA6364501.1 TIGR03503 family protein [Colwellia sp. BRX8-8]MBA6354156.1 TIGR03503 family protein [Colwellia sp. BRX9-1]MBA6356353.1 TIGR03503 family protein [Colwellia sp. BRX8-3]MBA6361897.1 TIGR03503 family protein [Colwellia sp. BRX8-6]MBA6369349.1 TIGR03503 family protein [Colwellia sp. BRX8-5]